ncbi:MAG: 3-phosphoshikimate 1-carboxyvinyltransferase [Bacilli bacterium]
MTETVVLASAQKKLVGTIAVPGDKSISHRSVMFGSLAEGKTTVSNFLLGDDCLSTIDCFRKLGVEIEVIEDNVTIHGKGVEGLNESTTLLDVGNSGTTIRLITGILAGTSLFSSLIGDASIAKRPMRRVVGPLREMGAQIFGRADGQYTPLAVVGTKLVGTEHTLKVASAQVKSAILLAGLSANGTTVVTEPEKSRDHTERMLRSFGVDVTEEGNTVSIVGGQKLSATHIDVPGDISSAAFFLVAGAITPNSSITITGVGMNPTRSGIVDVLKAMGADLEITNARMQQSEPVADLTISYSQLKGTIIDGELIPRLIDEIPIIALLATQAEGRTVIRDAEELKVKESNRIDSVVNELRKLGANIVATDDGMIIEGGNTLTAASVESYHDHRIGMMLAIATLVTTGEMHIANGHCVTVSYPNFYEQLQQLQN